MPPFHVKQRTGRGTRAHRGEPAIAHGGTMSHPRANSRWRASSGSLGQDYRGSRMKARRGEFLTASSAHGQHSRSPAHPGWQHRRVRGKPGSALSSDGLPPVRRRCLLAYGPLRQVTRVVSRGTGGPVDVRSPSGADSAAESAKSMTSCDLGGGVDVIQGDGTGGGMPRPPAHPRGVGPIGLVGDTSRRSRTLRRARDVSGRGPRVTHQATVRMPMPPWDVVCSSGRGFHVERRIARRPAGSPEPAGVRRTFFERGRDPHCV